MREKRAVIINGKARAGKDSFVLMATKHLATLGLVAGNYSSVDRVKLAGKLLGWDGLKDGKGRQFLSDLKDLSSRLYDGPMIYMKNILQSDDRTEDVIFFHVREPEEIARFLKDVPGSISVIIHREGLEEFGNHADLNVVNHVYDYEVQNNGSLEQVDEQALAFAQHLAGNE